MPDENTPADQRGKWRELLVAQLPQVGTWIATIAMIGLTLGIGWLVTQGLVGSNSLIRDLASVDYARGLITFIFAIGTIGIALLLTLGALLGSHPEEIFAKAKEVLTALIGVFGTILGFYFGTSSGAESNKISISPPTVQVAQAGAGPATILAYVAGGDPPYMYDITFDPKDTVEPVVGKASPDGWIRETVALDKLGDKKTLGYQISVVDARKRSGTYQAPDAKRIEKKQPVSP